MNRTNIEHAAFAMLFQLPFLLVGLYLDYTYPDSPWLLPCAAWLGAMLAFGFFLGREHAQREYKIGDPSKLIGYEAFDFPNWSLDALLDLIFPIIAVFWVAIVVTLYSRNIPW